MGMENVKTWIDDELSHKISSMLKRKHIGVTVFVSDHAVEAVVLWNSIWYRNDCGFECTMESVKELYEEEYYLPNAVIEWDDARLEIETTFPHDDKAVDIETKAVFTSSKPVSQLDKNRIAEIIANTINFLFNI